MLVMYNDHQMSVVHLTHYTCQVATVYDCLLLFHWHTIMNSQYNLPLIGMPYESCSSDLAAVK